MTPNERKRLIEECAVVCELEMAAEFSRGRLQARGILMRAAGRIRKLQVEGAMGLTPDQKHTLQDKLMKVLNRVCKWRSAFAGWQLGTRSQEDPEAQAVRDQRELLILLRIEMNAIARCLQRAKLLDGDDFQRQLIEEAEALEKVFEQKFPGFFAEGHGMRMEMPLAAETMRNWRQ